jgi:hypothetical protein
MINGLPPTMDQRMIVRGSGGFDQIDTAVKSLNI